MRYSHQKIELKWQEFWAQKQTFSPRLETFPARKYYILDMFPYPSGKGLHVGHLRGYVATDVIARWKRMQNYTVFHPIGFDSFGLPAEQYAIQTKQDPTVFTDQNIANFLKQLKALGFAYDYKRILKTSDPRYYRWTQWIFQRFFEHKLAYKAKVPVNFCPALNTVLANEEVLPAPDGTMVSERGNHPVYRRLTEQWLLDIVQFAPFLLTGLSALNWPEAIKQAQIKWIGAENGYLYQARIRTPVKTPKTVSLSVFTNQLSDWYNAPFLYLDFENSQLDRYFSTAVRKRLLDIRSQLAQLPLHNVHSSTVKHYFLDSECRVWNPLLKKELPIYFVNFLEPNLPQQNLLLNCRRSPRLGKLAVRFNCLTTAEFRALYENPTIKSDATILSRHPRIKFTPFIHYRLRNWVFSRQRYWGEPFPILKTRQGLKLVDETTLPLQLPPFQAVAFQSKNLTPLSSVKRWLWKGYDPNVMPQWAGSSWYYLAYLLVKPDGDFYPLNSPLAKQILNHWMPVDLYIGGQEHAVSHLLYARFWNQFLVRNCQIYDHLEPFSTLLNQGLILGPDHKKMSKSRGNVVDPMQYLVSHGADALRLYIQFIGPFQAKIAWNEHNLDAMRKWLARVYTLFTTHRSFWKKENDHQIDHLMHKTIKVVTDCYQNQHFNVAIASLMTFINACYKTKSLYLPYGKIFLQLLHPICPHLTAELWSLWNFKHFIFDSNWPKHDPAHLKLPTVIYALQVNGKTKKTFPFPINAGKIAVLHYCEKHFLHLLPDAHQQIIFIANRVINFVKK